MKKFNERNKNKKNKKLILNKKERRKIRGLN